MTTKAQVHALPTKEPTHLSRGNSSGVWDYHQFVMQKGGIYINHTYHHIYFTTDEEIKDGDWQLFGNEVSIASEEYGIHPDARKIVATTNPELWDTYPDGMILLTTKVAKISEDFIEAFVREQGNIKEVLLETEELFNYKPFGRRNRKSYGEKLKLRSNGTVIIHPVKEKTITPEEMYLNMQYYMEYCQSNGYVTPHDWLTKHKHF